VSPARPVYRYSVIPGGAYNAHELAEAIERDPVVAAAYRTVSAGGVRAEGVPADRLAYMSYRIGDQIYWTKHPIRLRRGETILTNGSAQLRGRCGNGISLVPMLPTADSEPAPLELEALSAGESPLLPARRLAFDRAFALAAPAGTSLSFGHQDELGTGSPWGESSGASDLPFPPGLFPGTPPVGSTPIPPDTSPSGPPPPDVPGSDTPTGSPIPSDTPPPGGPTPETPSAPVPTPEPGTILLVGGGVVAAALRRLRSRGKAGSRGTGD
jgi:PEP-CTERM motif